MENQANAVAKKSSVKLSLRFVKEKFNVKEFLDSQAHLTHNRAAYKNTEKLYLEKVVKELKGQFGVKKGETFTPVEDSRQGEIIVFSDGSQAKNPLFHETMTQRIAKQLGHA